MEGKPDLIIGNYTDGNLVASLMSSKLGVTQVGLVIDSVIFNWPSRFQGACDDPLSYHLVGHNCSCTGEN